MEEWNKLKNEIKIETKTFFQNKPQINIDKMIDLLQAVCAYSIDSRYKLDGVAIKIPKAMFQILDENTTKKEQILYFEVLSKFEPFLRKLLCIIDSTKYDSLLLQNKGLAAIISALHLNDAKIDYKDENSQGQRTYCDYYYHLYRVYNLRNIQSHDMEMWSTSELAQNIESIFIFYICVIEKNFRNIEKVISTTKRQDYTEYLYKVKQEFEKRAKRFVHIVSIEDYSLFESFAIEHIDLSDEDEHHERTGAIDVIRKQYLPEKRMMIWGDAGMGKSTTLQYLSYLDADDFLKGTSSKIPVYVPLGLLIDINEKIEDYIIKKIGVEYVEGLELLKKGQINLFLDGVNEVPIDISKSMQVQRRKEIQYLLDTYPNMLIIISNRPERYNYFKNIPVFRLQKMDKTKIQEFMDKNVQNVSVRATILEGIKNNFKLQQLIGIPLMATRLVEIVIDLKEFPQNEGTIIGRFIQTLYKREIVEKKDTEFDEQKIDYLLCNLAEYSLDKYHTNSGISKLEVLQCFANCMNKLCFSYDGIYVINKLVELGVLECENDIIVFAHQAYQDYYYSRAKKIQNISFLTPDSIPHCEQEHIPQSENTMFYKEKANVPQYEKSTIYLLHSYEGKQGEIELFELMKNNLHLAAKVVASGNYRLEVEKKIVEKAIDNIESNKRTNIITGFLTLLELGRYSEIIQSINVLVANKRNKYMVNNIIMQLDSKNMLMFFEALLKTRDSQVISVAINAVYMRDYEYTWNNENINTIERISNDMRSMFSSTTKILLKFYISFNVPKAYIEYNMMYIANKLKYQDTDLAEKFVQKYSLNISMEYEEICKKIVKKDKWTSAKNSIHILEKMSLDERIAYLKLAVENNNTYLIYYIFSILRTKQQSIYLKFYNNEINENRATHISRLPIIISPEDAEEILKHSISKNNRL